LQKFHFPPQGFPSCFDPIQLVPAAQLTFFSSSDQSACSAAQPTLQPKSAQHQPAQPTPPPSSLCRCQVGPVGHPRPPAGPRAEPAARAASRAGRAPAHSLPWARLPRPSPVPIKPLPLLRRFLFAPNPKQPRAAATSNPRRRRQLRSPRSWPLRRRGVVQGLRSVVRKPLVPRFCVAEPFVAGTPSPEQVLTAARLSWTVCRRRRANRCETPWLCLRGPQLAPGPDRVENCGRTFHPGQLRRGAAAHR
jgi:hypothetical protein